MKRFDQTKPGGCIPGLDDLLGVKAGQGAEKSVDKRLSRCIIIVIKKKNKLAV